MHQSDYASSQTSTMAIISVISGVLSWVALPFIGAIVAIVTGHMARNEIKSNPGMQGDGLAIAGLILGYLHIVTFCGGLLLFLLFFGGMVGLTGCAILSEAGQSGASLSIPPIPSTDEPFTYQRDPAKLQESRRHTLQLIDAIDAEVAIQRPRPDAWSIKDHITHLVAVEESVIHFAHRILDEDCPISPLCHDVAFNQDVWNNREVAERAGYTWTEARCALDATRQELLTLLDHIPPEALDRLGSHPVWGTPVTLGSVLRVPYRHERGHRDEIAALVTVGLPSPNLQP